jgi:hypothetical protein
VLKSVRQVGMKTRIPVRPPAIAAVSRRLGRRARKNRIRVGVGT